MRRGMTGCVAVSRLRYREMGDAAAPLAGRARRALWRTASAKPTTNASQAGSGPWGRAAAWQPGRARGRAEQRPRHNSKQHGDCGGAAGQEAAAAAAAVAAGRGASARETGRKELQTGAAQLQWRAGPGVGSGWTV